MRCSVLALCVAACVAACPEHLVNRTRCNPVNDIVGSEAETCVGTFAEFPVVDALEWAFECGLPIEVTVGLTMSLTGNYSDDSLNQNVLQVLKDWSSQTSIKKVGMKLKGVALGQIQMCTRFCVMDDESSEEKMVQLYRSFAGDGNGTSHALPLLLGPGTEAFRNAAAQVAQDYQRPMILWSIPKELRSFPILPKDPPLSEVIESIEVPANQVIREEIAKMNERSSEIYSSFYDPPSNSCRDFPVPAGYYLRSGAEFLSCGEPCDPVAHLDLCCRLSRGLLVSGTWSPSSALLSGGWQDGCLRGQSLANETTNMSLVLNFDRSPAAVIISLNWTNIAPAAPEPYLVVDEQVFKVRETLLDVLREDSVVDFSYVGDAEVTWEICLRESCSALSCSALPPRSGESCLGRFCDDSRDTAICCSLEPVDLNGIMWKGGSLNSSVFDLVAPVSGWALDVIAQLQKTVGGRFLCVAQQLSSNGLFFSNLCRHYNRMIGQKKADIMLAGGALDAVSSMVRLKPGPSIVLVCSDLGFYMSFLHAGMMLTPDHGTVVSCLPFGSLLDTVRGFELNFRSLEPQPWPSYRQLSSFKIQKPLGDLAAFRNSFTQVYQQHLQQNGSFPTELLFLYSAWQVIDKTAMTVAGSVLEYSFLKQRGRRDALQELSSNVFSTYLGGVSFERGQRNLQRTDVATRQAVPLTSSASMSGLAPNVSWTLKMAKFLRSSMRISDVFEPVLTVSNQLDINAWYPCPEGCVVHKTGCRACPPGTYRSLSQRECQPCLSGTYQDSYAASKCFACPRGASCNVTGAPFAKPGYFAVKAQESLIYAAWNGPEACSIEAGGGLATLHPNDIGSWSQSKKEALWRVQQCEPKSVCLGGNVCSASQVGFGCYDCQTGYSRILSHGDTCVACLGFTPLLRRCVAFAMLQVFVALLLAAASQKDVGELDCLLSPILLSLLVALQCFWMLFQTVERAGMIDDNQVIYGGLRSVIDAFMVPFLLPLLECAPEGSLTRSAENQAWAAFASAICIYVLIIILWLLLSCLDAARHGLQRQGISLKAYLVAANHLVLPSLLYWTLTTALHCTREISGAWGSEHAELRDPHIAAMVYVSLLFFLEGFAVWVYRHDFFQVSHRKDFGLLCTGVHRPYALWPLWEFLYLLMMASVLSASNALELPVVAVFWLIVLANALSFVMLAMVHPYLSVVVPRYKQSIAKSICLLSILLSCDSVFVDFFSDHDLEFLRWIEQLLIELFLFYLVAKGLWILFMNRVIIPVTIMEDTFYPWKSLRWLVFFLRRATGLQRLRALKRHGDIEFHTNSWSKSQEIEISWSIGHILHGQLQISSTLRMEEVHSVLEGAVRAVCRSHKSASVKHLFGGGETTIARRAKSEGKSISDCIQSHAGDFIAHELSVAVHDQNVDMASAVRAAEAAAERQAAARAAEGEFEELEEEVNLPSPPGRVKRKKVLLVPGRWPRPRRPTRLNRAAATVEMLLDTELEDEVDVEKQIWDLRKGYKRLESKMAIMLRRMNDVSEAFVDSKPSLLREVKEAFCLLNEIQMQLDTVQVDHISAERIRSWIGSIRDLSARAEVEAQPLTREDVPLTPELVELLGNECNEVLDLETRATSTGSRSHSEDSLERHLLQTNELPAPPAASTGGSTAPSVASMSILRSKPRPVGRSTARLHAWQTQRPTLK